MDVQSHSQCHTLTNPLPSKTLVSKNATKFCFLKTKEGEYIQQMKLSINSLNLALIQSHENSSFKILQQNENVLIA